MQTIYGDQLQARSTYEKGKAFLGAAILLGKVNGDGWVRLHLIGQSIELLLKSLLLAKDYKKYNPILKPKFGHNLNKLANAVIASYNLKGINKTLLDQLNFLNQLYFNQQLRYASIADFFLIPNSIETDLLLRHVKLLIHLADRNDIFVEDILR